MHNKQFHTRNSAAEARVTYCVRDGNIDKAFQDHRAELVHDLNHGFVVILQITKSQPVNSDIQLLFYCCLTRSRCTSDCFMAAKRLRISLSTEMASLRVVI